MSEIAFQHRTIPSRFGDLVLVWREDDSGPKVVRLDLPAKAMPTVARAKADHTHKEIAHLAEQIRLYLDGAAIELPINRLDSTRCSEFQWRVLMTEKAIPRGLVCSYGQVAAMIGRPNAARAVGNALARNPFPLIIPCHRAVRRNGALGGFGGGLPMKRALLEMERVGFDHRGRVSPEFFWQATL